MPRTAVASFATLTNEVVERNVFLRLRCDEQSMPVRLCFLTSCTVCSSFRQQCTRLLFHQSTRVDISFGEVCQSSTMSSLSSTLHRVAAPPPCLYIRQTTCDCGHHCLRSCRRHAASDSGVGFGQRCQTPLKHVNPSAECDSAGARYPLDRRLSRGATQYSCPQ